MKMHFPFSPIFISLLLYNFLLSSHSPHSLNLFNLIIHSSPSEAVGGSERKTQGNAQSFQGENEKAFIKSCEILCSRAFSIQIESHHDLFIIIIIMWMRLCEMIEWSVKEQNNIKTKHFHVVGGKFRCTRPHILDLIEFEIFLFPFSPMRAIVIMQIFLKICHHFHVAFLH